MDVFSSQGRATTTKKNEKKKLAVGRPAGVFFFRTEHVPFFVQGSLNYLFWGDETLQIYGKFMGFPL